MKLSFFTIFCLLFCVANGGLFGLFRESKVNGGMLPWLYKSIRNRELHKMIKTSQDILLDKKKGGEVDPETQNLEEELEELENLLLVSEVLEELKDNNYDDNSIDYEGAIPPDEFRRNYNEYLYDY